MRTLLFFIVFGAALVHAQTEPYYTQPIDISITPTFPEPGSYALARVTSPLVELEQARILWSAAGETLGEGSEVTFLVGTEALTVVALAELNGVVYRAERTIRPARVDLVWEASTYAPTLFTGKRLPTPGSNIRIQALPEIYREGTLVPAEELQFVWRKNGALINAASGKGRSAITLPAPFLFGTDTVSVEVTSADQTTASSDVVLTTGDPEVLLYENHPIFGLQLRRALTRSLLPEVEVTLTALPLFSAYAPRDPSLTYEWFVNDRAITADETHPNSLTVNAENSTGEARIRLSLKHATNFFFSAGGDWALDLRSIPTLRDPFLSAP